MQQTLAPESTDPQPARDDKRHGCRTLRTSFTARDVDSYARQLEHCKIELEYAMARGHDSVDSIAKTVFASESESDGYQFVVSEQRYRK